MGETKRGKKNIEGKGIKKTYLEGRTQEEEEEEEEENIGEISERREKMEGREKGERKGTCAPKGIPEERKEDKIPKGRSKRRGKEEGKHLVTLKAEDKKQNKK